MRRQSKKRQALMREVSDGRCDFIREYMKCWVCGTDRALTVHEIACGPAREQALSERAAWMVACAPCNCGPLHDKTLWPVARQLALKAWYDPDHYDRVKVNLLRGRQPDAITEAEVVKAAFLSTMP